MKKRSFYVLAYDISSDRRRAKIARLMEQVGERVQGSVFEAYLAAAELEGLLKRVKKILEVSEDSLRIYYLCQDCRARIKTDGLGKVTEAPGVMIV